MYWEGLKELERIESIQMIKNLKIQQIMCSVLYGEFKQAKKLKSEEKNKKSETKPGLYSNIDLFDSYSICFSFNKR